MDSSFPIKIQYTRTKEIVIISDPKEIRSGEGFKVLETRIKKLVCL